MHIAKNIIKDQIYQTTKVVTDKAADVAEIGRDAGYAAQEGARDIAIEYTIFQYALDDSSEDDPSEY